MENYFQWKSVIVMKVPLLNFVGDPGTSPLNSEVGSGFPLINFRGDPGPTFKLWGGCRVPSSRVSRSRVPGSWSHFYPMPSKTGQFDIIIKRNSFIFLRYYKLFDTTFVYCCSFPSRIVNKMLYFSYEKVYVRLCRFSFKAYAKNVREKAVKCSLKTTEVLLNTNGHVLT